MKRAMVFLLALAVFTACNNTPKATEEKKPVPKVSSSLDSLGTENLIFVVNKYYELKDALVATNAARVSSAAASLCASADSFKMMLTNRDSAKVTTIAPMLDSIILHGKAITTITDATCEQQRIQFSPVSEAIYTLVKQVNVKNGGIYRQYCPMAFDNKGAHWLSNSNEIMNPYFGKKMLECGEVKDSL